jgi:hypothetical protein
MYMKKMIFYSVFIVIIVCTMEGAPDILEGHCSIKVSNQSNEGRTDRRTKQTEYLTRITRRIQKFFIIVAVLAGVCIISGIAYLAQQTQQQDEYAPCKAVVDRLAIQRIGNFTRQCFAHQCAVLMIRNQLCYYDRWHAKDAHIKVGGIYRVGRHGVEWIEGLPMCDRTEYSTMSTAYLYGKYATIFGIIWGVIIVPMFYFAREDIACYVAYSINKPLFSPPTR